MMPKPLFKTFLTVLFVFFIACIPAFAEDLVLSSDYVPSYAEPETFPDVLKIGASMECGTLSFKLTAQPVITKSGHGILSDQDTKYLVIRLNITNSGDETVGWLTPDSFYVQETYLDQIYGTYRLNVIMSAKMASGYHVPAFYSSIAPGKMIQTVLVFSVFPEVDSWILNIAPKVLGETEAEDVIRFQLPKALVQ